ncbi:MAG: hypothetical protein WAV51_01490 [Microgenomates group bacterium]
MISFIYFDVGGVVIKDFSGTNKWNELKRRIGIPDEQIQDVDDRWKQYKDPIDNGDINLTVIETMLRQEFQIPIPKNYSMLDDFVDHFERNPSIWSVIKEIHTTHRVGLLTNMYIGMFEKIVKRDLLPPEIWDTIIDSSIIHMKKPDKNIYEFAQKQADVPASKILFVDNLERNLTPAIELGWQTFLYDSKNPEDASKKLLQIFQTQ